MDVKATLHILGARSFKGDVDGTSHDFTKLAVVMDVSELRGNAVGQNTVDMTLGPASEFEKLKHLQFPLVADCGLRLTTKGYELASFAPRAPVPPKAS